MQAQIDRHGGPAPEVVPHHFTSRLVSRIASG
ncbi:hypothetical protein SAMN05421538_103237 [Paracoccus isoporae]|uniref:Uncharacterized protein n=1 Tax=Paracoccus isoporae TaxID=591205 RepID=A0A1G6ZEK6_9RHOB|nr:hypothetical protein SAMN05421538_103237 [Paracoccus isoporae]